LPRPGEECSTLFIPDNSRSKDIDALYLKVNDRIKSAWVVPIQITINSKHKDSEAGFYTRWDQWEAHFEGYQLSTVFVWIVEDQNSWEEMEAQYLETRNRLRIVMPAHKHVAMPIMDVYKPLGEMVARCRAPPTPPRTGPLRQATIRAIAESDVSSGPIDPLGESPIRGVNSRKRGGGTKRGRGRAKGVGVPRIAEGDEDRTLKPRRSSRKR